MLNKSKFLLGKAKLHTLKSGGGRFRSSGHGFLVGPSYPQQRHPAWSFRSPILSHTATLCTRRQIRLYSLDNKPISDSSGPAGATEKERESKAPGDTSVKVGEDKGEREVLWNIPNALTLSRICATPIICWSIFSSNAPVALVGTFYAAVTDWLDGFLARRWGQQTSFGAKLDPLADKVMVGAISATLWSMGALPTYVVAAVLGRDVCLVGGFFLLKYLSMPKGERRVGEVLKIGNDTHIQVQPTQLSKFNTFLQFCLLLAACGSVFHPATALEHSVWGLAPLVTGTTVVSGLDYGRKFLEGQKQQQQKTE